MGQLDRWNTAGPTTFEQDMPQQAASPAQQWAPDVQEVGGKFEAWNGAGTEQ